MIMNNASDDIYKKKLGARILSEANDLKRNIQALAADLGMDEELVQRAVNGEESLEVQYSIVEKMGETYPIDHTDMYIPVDDCTDGVKIMRAEESKRSSRVFNRKNSRGAPTPFYEYRDTAMSVHSPFRPEWIKELRVVDDDDPENPDVVYNKGHFMHQLTFFIGPVNFYYDVFGKKACAQMNTGDSNYITPFHPHTFTSRDTEQDAIIIAVTFGGDVRQSQKELYALGEKGERFVLDVRNPRRAQAQRIEQCMQAANISKECLQGQGINPDEVLGGGELLGADTLAKLAELLRVDPVELRIPAYREEEEVVVRYGSKESGYLYPSEQESVYRIFPLAQTYKLPFVRGFRYHVMTDQRTGAAVLEHQLHSYLYNYGDIPIMLHWNNGDEWYAECIEPNDSAYVQPFTKYAFTNTEGEGSLIEIRIPGKVGSATIRELSTFADPARAIKETTCWYDQK